jgi:excisionase family DNA binding protein
METRETPERVLHAPPLLTVEEAAQVARVARSTIWKRVRSGEIPAIRVGSRTGPIRIPTAEYIEWLYGVAVREEEFEIPEEKSAAWSGIAAETFPYDADEAA